MRTSIEIDDELMADAFRISGLKTKREVVHWALRHMVRMAMQKEIRSLRGKVKWEGSLEESRLNRW